MNRRTLGLVCVIVIALIVSFWPSVPVPSTVVPTATVEAAVEPTDEVEDDGVREIVAPSSYIPLPECETWSQDLDGIRLDLEPGITSTVTVDPVIHVFSTCFGLLMMQWEGQELDSMWLDDGIYYGLGTEGHQVETGAELSLVFHHSDEKLEAELDPVLNCQAQLRTKDGNIPLSFGEEFELPKLTGNARITADCDVGLKYLMDDGVSYHSNGWWNTFRVKQEVGFTFWEDDGDEITRIVVEEWSYDNCSYARVVQNEVTAMLPYNREYTIPVEGSFTISSACDSSLEYAWGANDSESLSLDAGEEVTFSSSDEKRYITLLLTK